MDGQPVWLCSVAHYDRRGLVATGSWTPADRQMAERLAHSALKGVGNETRERAFRMNVTFCVHRIISEAERATLPEEWHDAPGALAGGPVEVLWSRGIEHRPVAMPCVRPGRLVIDPSRPDLFVPLDCGSCEPCRGRAEIEARIGYVNV